MSLWKKFTEPLPIARKWSVLIRVVMYGFPIATAILALGCMCFVSASIQKPSRTIAVCVELEQAIMRYYDDHGVMPIDVGGDVTIDCNSGKGIELLRVLMNQEVGDSPRNTKGRKYLNVRQGSDQRDGLIWNDAGTQVDGLYDPWGGSFMIALDGDFDESITVQPKAAEESRTLQRRVAVWSDGKDTEDTKDDVTTW